ncbi:MAG: ATP-binding protein [Lachnospiraceae bacterium]|nr:ATP-binding protein [Lachnospiraceae bacterium]
MGLYLNPGYAGFEEIRRDIYVDKTGLISFMNSLIGKPKPLVSFSRPRRFGKSYDANMICAYYDKSCDSRFLFEDLKISKDDSFEKHLNKYNVITFDVTGFIADSKDNDTDIVLNIKNTLFEELRGVFPGCIADEEKNLGKALYAVVSNGNEKFVFVIDEWDALFREYKDDKQLQEDYILFLRSLFKNKDTTSRTIAAAYMTGILPIKKYGTESALTDFKEYSMTRPGRLAEYIGFTEDEVKRLCDEYQMEFGDMQSWYDGYSFNRIEHVYSPNSVMNALQEEEIANYWTQTETFESLRKYIEINMDGLKDAILLMLGGQRVQIDVSTFQNDITSFRNKDDVLTLLIHLGYLAYDQKKKEVYIPNQEVTEAFQSSIKGGNWKNVEQAISNAERLLDATLRRESDSVAQALEAVHEECSSVLTYNDESSLACAIYIAYYTARNYYKVIRELPTGKGFADYAFVPGRDTDKPAMIIELKYDKNADTAIRQIHENRYAGDLKGYFGNLLLVGINYDKDAKGTNAKRHSCVIEMV